VLGIPLPQFITEDSFYWGHTRLGEFSMKSVTWLAHDNMDYFNTV